jgi:phosphoglycolate phosphatase
VRLFLFDVDGTLISARGAGRRALQQALQRVYGTTGPIQAHDFRGRTDPQIVGELLRAAGLSEAAIAAGLDACFAAYVEELARLVRDGGVEVMPGIAGLVAALAGRPDAVVGLLTGNIEPGARVKLAPTGLWPRFRLGAFGSDHADRRRLPAIARARAQALTGHAFTYERITIIGDTPLDVDCARACGALAVAVATGHHPRAELEGCRPDLLFADFSDVEAALRALVAP